MRKIFKSIEDLKRHLPEGYINILKSNNISTISRFRQYYEQNGTFSKLSGITQKKNDEIVYFIERVNLERRVSLNDDIGNLEILRYDIVKNLYSVGIQTNKELLEFYKKQKTFTSVKFIGEEKNQLILDYMERIGLKK